MARDKGPGCQRAQHDFWLHHIARGKWLFVQRRVGRQQQSPAVDPLAHEGMVRHRIDLLQQIISTGLEPLAQVG